MGGKNWTGIKAYTKALVLAAGLMSPCTASAGQPGSAYLGPLQYSLGAPIAAAVTAVEFWRAKASAALATAGRHDIAALASAPSSRKPATRQDGGAVFQSVAFRVSSIPAAEKWRAVYPRITEADFESCDTPRQCEASAILRKAMANAAGSGFHQKLSGINRTVNWLVRYQPDAQNYGKRDYWAAPAEILARGKGDCEDYAILKMAALKELGLPPRSMSIVVLRDTRRNLYHAVLTVMTSQGYFILDNLSNEVKLDSTLPEYQPLFSVSADRTWIHGIRTGSDKIASAAPLLPDVMPGEGTLR
ncbi:transglutaminase-like cysteine peptidase [Sinorhizobium alkalisoli]|uniref:transglutaminase-like cysteine peptidase n=1 Tax=Sinorhizobium alkalisoli TaxID=1752398 RepID=UPI000A50BB40|nr:transglutaminase-like cysteine peptidase [Sinorhizobium alkalisoli]